MKTKLTVQNATLLTMEVRMIVRSGAVIAPQKAIRSHLALRSARPVGHSRMPSLPVAAVLTATDPIKRAAGGRLPEKQKRSAERPIVWASPSQFTNHARSSRPPL